MTDVNQLLKDAADGDDNAFDTLIDMYRPMMRKIAKLYTHANDVDDVIQNAWIKIIKYRDRLSTVENMENWLFYVVRNSCYDNNKRSKHEIVSYEYNAEYFDSMFKDESILDYYLRKETNETLSQYIDELPDGLKLPVMLYYFQEMSVDEVAKTMNLPNSTIKWRLHTARLKLKTKIINGGKLL